MALKSTGTKQVIEEQLSERIQKIEDLMDADCLAYVGPIAFGVDDAIRDAVEEIENKKKKLVFILETSGGFAETTRRIADTVRHHYTTVDFLIPSYAMSAGTILAMAGDAIHMDYYSVLGPIDPQIEGPDGALIPALGYLIRYEDLLAKANDGKITSPEMDILLSFDQGQLYSYEQARDLSRSLLEEWLVKYKFKDWVETETQKTPVTEDMKKARSKEIADRLNNVRRWNSHGIGINMELLRKELNLKIDDFGQVPELSAAIRRYHKLLVDHGARMRHNSIVHTRDAYRPLAVR
ncbi:serine dehydrogenasease [Azospirillum melinis]|uniref:Serine dehydrogenasease n=1 Tax=Azospirillum melinis TaxID=328839 RepID=A0ABX2KJ64_9PROT|nr:ATP-dependent Clp protease proteolytic subunit [Azospirillum melinis]MBP2309419.1 hypothetical protein [Azospirillum melinis]NUB01823.1 serine dehydrogenasease [Azospirillum melinis]